MSPSGFLRASARLAEHYDALPDVAGFAPRYQRALELDVFTPDPTADPAYGEYLHGRDNVTESLIKQSVWEAQETTVVVDILDNVPGVVLDFGAHIGWYTVLAGVFGDHPVIAFEPDPLACEALRLNSARHGVRLDSRFGIGPDDPRVAVDGDVALMKCDIEGMDCWAVQACADLFCNQRIKYALIEVSPIFTDDGRGGCDYVEMVRCLLGWGYRCFRVPPKGWEHNDIYRAEPLRTLIRHREVGSDWAEVIAGCRQDNFMFVAAQAYETLAGAGVYDPAP